MVEYRIEYSKAGRARWLSHLELIRTFIRALRRSGLPLVFSQGFNPHPRLSYGPSLGVGVAGLREYLDLDLAAAMPLPEGMASLGRQLPPGLELGRLMELPPGAPGIGKAVNCAWYRLALPPEQTVDAWQQAIDRLVGGSDPLYYKRPKDGKLFDVRSGLTACRLTEGGGKRPEAGTVECWGFSRHLAGAHACTNRSRGSWPRPAGGFRGCGRTPARYRGNAAVIGIRGQKPDVRGWKKRFKSRSRRHARFSSGI